MLLDLTHVSSLFQRNVKAVLDGFWKTKIVLASLGLFLVGGGDALAYNLLGGRWQNSPTSGCCLSLRVAFQPGLTSYDPQGWSDGMNAWSYSAANLSYGQVGFYQPADVAAYDENNSADSWDGLTVLYPCNTCTYTAADVYLNAYFTHAYPRGEIQAVSAHELGHVPGLAHNTGCVLMNPYTSERWGTCGVNTPQSDDINGVNALY